VKPAPRLLDVPISGLYPITLGEANDFLIKVEHDLGPVHRPFRSEAFGLELDDRLIAVAVSASIVHGPVAGYERQEVVELARLGWTERWVGRIMLRYWREVCGPRWANWPVKAAVSYSNRRHTGDLYRFDGWRKVRDDAGSSGGGAWSRKRYATEAAFGKKTLWCWRYEEAA
jgi:hypothetical protein